MLKVANSVINASRITGVLPVANGGTNASTASITSFNNITGFTASGTTGTTSTNLVFATTPTLVGDVTLSTGNLVIGTSGKGIDFSVTSSDSGTMTSELLADYEEGTWDPRIAFGGSDTASYTGRVGSYTKIGRQVTVAAFIGTNANGAATGAATIINLPFTPVNSYGSFALFMEGISYTGMAVGTPNITLATLGLVQITEAGVLSALTNANWSASTDLRFSATYFV